jgi:hypothetical protein
VHSIRGVFPDDRSEGLRQNRIGRRSTGDVRHRSNGPDTFELKVIAAAGSFSA